MYSTGEAGRHESLENDEHRQQAEENERRKVAQEERRRHRQLEKERKLEENRRRQAKEEQRQMFAEEASIGQQLGCDEQELADKYGSVLRVSDWSFPTPESVVVSDQAIASVAQMDVANDETVAAAASNQKSKRRPGFNDTESNATRPFKKHKPSLDDKGVQASNKRITNPMAVLSPKVLAFLQTLGITTSDDLLSTPSPEIANAFVSWRKERNMKPLIGMGHYVAISGWKRAVRKVVDSTESKELGTNDSDVTFLPSKSHSKVAHHHGDPTMQPPLLAQASYAASLHQKSQSRIANDHCTLLPLQAIRADPLVLKRRALVSQVGCSPQAQDASMRNILGAVRANDCPLMQQPPPQAQPTDQQQEPPVHGSILKSDDDNDDQARRADHQATPSRAHGTTWPLDDHAQAQGASQNNLLDAIVANSSPPILRVPPQVLLRQGTALQFAGNVQAQDILGAVIAKGSQMQQPSQHAVQGDGNAQAHDVISRILLDAMLANSSPPMQQQPPPQDQQPGQLGTPSCGRPLQANGTAQAQEAISRILLSAMLANEIPPMQQPPLQNQRPGQLGTPSCGRPLQANGTAQAQEAISSILLGAMLANESPPMQQRSLQARRADTALLHVFQNDPPLLDGNAQQVIPSGRILDGDTTKMFARKRHVETSSFSSNPERILGRPSKDFGNPIKVLSPIVLAFLRTLGITTTESLFSTPTPEIANAFISWREQKQMIPLKGEGASSTVSARKAKVRKTAESAEEREEVPIHDGVQAYSRSIAGGSVGDAAKMPARKRQVGTSSAIPSLKKDCTRPDARLEDDPIEVLSATVRFFLRTLGITTAEKLFSTSTPEIADTFISWREERNMRALKGEGANGTVGGWKRLVKKADNGVQAHSPSTGGSAGDDAANKMPARKRRKVEPSSAMPSPRKA